MRTRISWSTILFRIGFLVLVLSLKTHSDSQERKHDSIAAHKQNETAGQVHCSISGTCVAEKLYIATVTDIFPNVTQGAFQVRLIVRFENVRDSAVLLGYRPHSASLLDNFKNRFYCCSSQSATDVSVVGMGIDTGNKVEAPLLLQPHESANVIFELWRHRDNVQAAYYDFDVMIDQIDPENNQRVLDNPNLSFRDLVPRTLPETHSGGEQSGH